jgi:hypothetical protein
LLRNKLSPSSDLLWTLSGWSLACTWSCRTPDCQ